MEVKFKETNEEQIANKEYIVITFDVLKLDKSKDFKEVQL